jgi:hypothetical protein
MAKSMFATPMVYRDSPFTNPFHCFANLLEVELKALSASSWWTQHVVQVSSVTSCLKEPTDLQGLKLFILADLRRRGATYPLDAR